MRPQSELWRADVLALSSMLDRGDVSPVEILDAFLARCEAVNPRVNAIVTWDLDGAYQAAREAEARQRRRARLGVLDGIPLSVKDNLFVGGLRATWGARLFREFVAPCDDVGIERIRAAGAVIVGKSNTPEFALAPHTTNVLFGATRNPWNLDLVPAGSTGGGAASVAAGMLPLAVGTDAGGSIRLPAAYTGVVGFKPSVGRVPRIHGFPPIALDFQVVGMIARSVAGVRALFDIMAGPDARDRASLLLAEPRDDAPSRKRRRIGYVTAVAGEPIDPEVLAAAARAAGTLEAMGHDIVPMPAPYDLDELKAFWHVLASSGLARVALRHADWEDMVTPPMAAIATSGRSITGAQYADAIDRLATFRAAVAVACREVDVLLTPVSPVLPWPIAAGPPSMVDGKATNPRTPMSFTTFVNAVGYPAIALPSGMSADGVPIGVQLVARFGHEAELFDLGASLEADAPWRDLWPDLG